MVSLLHFEYSPHGKAKVFRTKTGAVLGQFQHYAMSFANSYIDEPILLTEKERECQTFHSSTLSEIFFDTLDGIDCLRDPFSILK